jgi:16S rRNA (cytidine1402-2'-O)-methyltransferase
LTTIDINKLDLQAGLYLIAMPIGNPRDIGLRSIETLLAADVIACEDTRTFQNTMNQIVKHKWNLIAHHKNNEAQSAEGILQLIQSGKSVCMVSDAGTLNVSDPGAKALRLLLQNKIFITSLPGPSSLTTALSMYPILSNIHFGGFLPNKENEKNKLFDSLKSRQESLVFFESPHRLLETLEVALKSFSSRKLFIAREISKTYEEYLYIDIQEAIAIYNKKTPKGEFVLVFSPPTEIVDQSIDIKAEIVKLLKKKFSNKDILQKLKESFEVNRNEVYQWIEELKRGKD